MITRVQAALWGLVGALGLTLGACELGTYAVDGYCGANFRAHFELVDEACTCERVDLCLNLDSDGDNRYSISSGEGPSCYWHRESGRVMIAPFAYHDGPSGEPVNPDGYLRCDAPDSPAICACCADETPSCED